MKHREPQILRLGRTFGEVVAYEYLAGVGSIRGKREQYVARGSGRARWVGTTRRELHGARLGRQGRIDILLEVREDDGRTSAVVVEIKSTDWDRARPTRVRPNAVRHARQVWSYLEPLLERVDVGELAAVQGAVLYPHRPSLDRQTELQSVFDERGITVLYWEEITTDDV